MIVDKKLVEQRLEERERLIQVLKFQKRVKRVLLMGRLNPKFLDIFVLRVCIVFSRAKNVKMS